MRVFILLWLAVMSQFQAHAQKVLEKNFFEDGLVLRKMNAYATVCSAAPCARPPEDILIIVPLQQTSSTTQEGSFLDFSHVGQDALFVYEFYVKETSQKITVRFNCYLETITQQKLAQCPTQTLTAKSRDLLKPFKFEKYEMSSPHPFFIHASFESAD